MFKAIKYFFIFLYHFMFIDQATGTQSNTKFFANVGYIIWSVLFPIVVLKGPSTNMELWMIFGAVVIGNRTLNVMMQNKYGAAQNPGATWSGGVMAPADSTAPDPTAKTAQTAPQPAAISNPPLAAQSAPVIPKSDDLV